MAFFSLFPPFLRKPTPASEFSLTHGEFKNPNLSLERLRDDDRAFVLSLGPRAKLFVVLDGVGGHPRGGVAAQKVEDKVKEVMLTETSLPLIDRLVTAVQMAAWDVHHDNVKSKRKEKEAMGTTIAALLFMEDSAFTVHVGDSRIWRVRKKESIAEQLTFDDNYPGQIMKELASRAENEGLNLKNYLKQNSDARKALEFAASPDPQLFKFLGYRDLVAKYDSASEFSVDRTPLGPPKVGDRYLLTTDGAHYKLSEEDIGGIVASSDDPQKNAERIVRKAIEKGSRDNATAIAVHVVPAMG